MVVVVIMSIKVVVGVLIWVTSNGGRGCDGGDGNGGSRDDDCVCCRD